MTDDVDEAVTWIQAAFEAELVDRDLMTRASEHAAATPIGQARTSRSEAPTLMRIAIGCDHAGFPLKAPIVELLESPGHEVVDFGTDSTEPVDYPDFIAPAARAVASGELPFAHRPRRQRHRRADRRQQDPRHPLRRGGTDPVTARLGREHNDANALSMGARIVGSRGRAGLRCGVSRRPSSRAVATRGAWPR